jgi:hypothetical protein
MMDHEQPGDAASGVGGLNGYFWERREWGDGNVFYYFPLSGQFLLGKW